MNDTNSRSGLRLIIGVLIGIVGIWLVLTLFTGTGLGMGNTMGQSYGGSHMGTGLGYGATGSIYVLLVFLIKVLFVLFIIGLVIGIAVAASRYLFTEKDIINIKSTFRGNRTVVIKETCVVCGKEQNDDWKVCPFCGQEKEN